MKILVSKNDFLEILKPDGGIFGVHNLDSAYQFCKKITINHYENFPVGSVIIPKKFRNHFFSVYAFSRIADDIADELSYESPDDRIELLNRLMELIKSKDEIGSFYKNPLKIALYNTIIEKSIPFEPFEKLIDAFKFDSNFKQPATMNENISYCQFSANPVGELVLRIFDEYDNEKSKYSNAVCTGLQLVNFWQDISRDYKINRIFIPKDYLTKYQILDLYESSLQTKTNINNCLKDIYDFTENLFIFGISLVKLIKNKRLKFEILVTIEGGLRVLKLSKNLGYNILYNRPKLEKIDYIAIFVKSILRFVFK